MERGYIETETNHYIDMHAHIYPGKIAKKACEAISDFYNVPVKGSGTADDLIERANKAHIGRILVHSTATKQEQVISINDFIIKSINENNRFVGFGTLHPDFEDKENEVKRLIENGIKGIKLHPEFQRFNIDDPIAFGMYEACEGKLPILFHTGDNRFDYSSPVRLAKILDIFPDLVVIAAHFGGYRRWDEACEYLAGRKNVYFDTSSSLDFIDKDILEKLILKHGTDGILFGSDYPMWEPEEEIIKLRNIGVSEDDLDKILYKNAEIFLGLN